MKNVTRMFEIREQWSRGVFNKIGRVVFQVITLLDCFVCEEAVFFPHLFLNRMTIGGNDSIRYIP